MEHEGHRRFKSLFKFANERLPHRPSVQLLCNSPAPFTPRHARCLVSSEGSAMRFRHVWLRPPTTYGGLAPFPSRTPPVKGASVGLSPGDLVPTWFQLEPTVHNAIAPACYGSMRFSILRTSIFSAATPADVCGTSRRGRTDHPVKRC
jgi:hypothetical protein